VKIYQEKAPSVNMPGAVVGTSSNQSRGFGKAAHQVEILDSLARASFQEIIECRDYHDISPKLQNLDVTIIRPDNVFSLDTRRENDSDKGRFFVYLGIQFGQIPETISDLNENR
jgi:hypothetical protein